MSVERGEDTAGHAAKGAKAQRFLGSLKDALKAASRDDTGAANAGAAKPAAVINAAHAAAGKGDAAAAPIATPANDDARGPVANTQNQTGAGQNGAGLSAQEAARQARATPATLAIRPIDGTPDRHVESDVPPTTRVVRAPQAAASPSSPPPRAADPKTQLVRGRQAIARDTFAQDPVVGFLVVVGGPGLGAFRPVYEGNNTVGRAGGNRITFDFGDETISADAQAYIRYDSTDRSFLFVPNLAKTNIVSVNEKRPTGAVELKAMDVITLGRTQVAFLPFCGSEFDWSEISDCQDE
ncbi:MAG: FHA domain-containing protein [Hyphomicrobium sp.]